MNQTKTVEVTQYVVVKLTIDVQVPVHYNSEQTDDYTNSLIENMIADMDYHFNSKTDNVSIESTEILGAFEQNPC